MNGALSTRGFADADLDAALELWRATAGVELAEGDGRDELVRYLARNPGLSRVAVIGDQLVGAVLCGHDGRRGLIYHLAVAPAFRGRGLGRRLLADCLAGLRQAGMKRAIILVARDNAGGSEFWTSQGFEQIVGAAPLGLDL